MIELSVVIPVRNEEENIPELVSRLRNTLDEMFPKNYEVIFVTDINTDNTLALLKQVNRSYPQVKTIKLSNSFGQHIAVYAGLNYSSGNTVVIMDGDLQDYPEDIKILHHKLQEGYDVVYGIKEHKDDSWIRNLCSKLFVKVMNWFSDYPFDFNTAMFRIMSRRTVDELLKFKEREPSLTALVTLIGYPTVKVLVTSGKRLKGNTKYNFMRQINMAINFLVSFSTKPLRILSYIGFSVAGLSLFYLMVVLFQSFILRVKVMGWPTIVSLITFLGGLQLFGLGVIGEYIGRIFMETKRRPMYFIEDKIGEFK